MMMYNSDSLESMEYASQDLVQGYPPGLMLLAGAPKVGKSWYALNLLAREAQNHKALYLALEDTPRRLKERLWQLGLGYPPNLFLSHDREDIDIDEFLEMHPDARMIVVDTLEQYEPGGFNSYTTSVQSLNRLHKICENHPDLLIVVIHHTNKNGKGFDKILGGTGITGSVDTLILVERDLMTGNVRLQITGRDIEQDTVDLHFQDGTFYDERQTNVQEFHQLGIGAVILASMWLMFVIFFVIGVIKS